MREGTDPRPKAAFTHAAVAEGTAGAAHGGPRPDWGVPVVGGRPRLSSEANPVRNRQSSLAETVGSVKAAKPPGGFGRFRGCVVGNGARAP